MLSIILILAKPRTHNKNAAAVGSILKVTKIIDIKKNIIPFKVGFYLELFEALFALKALSLNV